MDENLTLAEKAVYVGGFAAGFLGAWLIDKVVEWRTFHLQKRIVIGWAEYFCIQGTAGEQ